MDLVKIGQGTGEFFFISFYVLIYKSLQNIYQEKKTTFMQENYTMRKDKKTTHSDSRRGQIS